MRRLLLSLAALALVVSACGDDDDEATDADTTEVDTTEADTTEADAGTTSEAEQDIDPEAPSGGEPAEVVAADFAFEPESVEVAAGDSVTWSNEDGVGHTVTAGTPEEPSGEFDELLDAGGAAEVTFAEEGSFPYFCAIHPTMTGEVVVG